MFQNKGVLSPNLKFEIDSTDEHTHILDEAIE